MRNKLKGLIIGIILGICMNNSIPVYAATVPDGRTLSNDDKWSTIPSSYSGLDYYDCLIPYSFNLTEIGGWSEGGKDTSGVDNDSNIMDTSRRVTKVGDFINLECDLPNSTNTAKFKSGKSFSNCHIEHDSSGMVIAVNDNTGKRFYVAALPSYCYPESIAGKDGFPAWGSVNRGQLFDVILTDGTVLHMVLGDAKANVHTNGGSGSSHTGDVRNHYKDYYRFTPMEMPKGQNMFQAYAGEVLEMFCTGGTALSAFRGSIGVNESGSGNHIAVIRMYNGYISDDDTSSRSESGVESTLGSVTVEATVGESITNMGTASLGLTGSNMVEEWDLLGMPAKIDMTAEQAAVILATRDDLSFNESEIVALMGDNIALLKEARLLDYMRIGVIFMGLVVLAWGFFLGVAILFDKTNTFLDISMVNILTLGKMHYDPFQEKDHKAPKGYVTTKRLVIMVAIITLVGMLLVSGGVTRFVGQILYKITGLVH